MNLKNPLETLEVIYDLLLQSESEFDMLVFLLILFGENSYPALMFQTKNHLNVLDIIFFIIYFMAVTKKLSII